MGAFDLDLDERLEALAALVVPGEPMIDVGTDHGRLPAALVERGVVPRAIASDIAPGPLAGARARIAAAGLTDRVELRLAPGLAGLAPGEATTAVIAGMGGKRIATILDTAPLDHLGPSGRLVVSPHTNVPELRDALIRHGFAPLVDRVVTRGGQFYWVIAAERGHAVVGPRERLVGALARDRCGAEYEAWLDAELVRIDDALARIGPGPQDEGSRRRLSAQRSALVWARFSR